MQCRGPLRKVHRPGEKRSRFPEVTTSDTAGGPPAATPGLRPAWIVEAIILWADVMPRFKIPKEGRFSDVLQPFFDQFTDHGNKALGGADRCSSGEQDIMLLHYSGRFFIEIKHDFHVIADKSNQGDDYACRSGGEFVDDIARIGF